LTEFGQIEQSQKKGKFFTDGRKINFSKLAWVALGKEYKKADGGKPRARNREANELF
jgi:hypothetical protein